MSEQTKLILNEDCDTVESDSVFVFDAVSLSLRTDSGAPTQISLSIKALLPHPAGLSGGRVPPAHGRRRQAVQRGI